MATVSGMKYDQVQLLIEFLNEKASAINTTMDELLKVPGALTQVYSGTAAEAYKDALTNCSTTIQTTLNDLIAALKAQAEAKQTEYGQQEEKLASSVDA